MRFISRLSCVLVAGLAFAACAGDTSDNRGTDGTKDSETPSGTADTGSAKDTSSSTAIDSATETSPPDSDLVTWIALPGGTFMQGSEPGQGNYDQTPRHQVTLEGFEIMKNEVTVGQYEACVKAHSCTALEKGVGCNWGAAGKNDHPANCVAETQAEVFCAWVGGRLPSESEWEYAARSGGKEPKNFPWGEEEPTCERAVLQERGQDAGCGAGGTMPVCSKPLGNTEQGLCDMAGNVDEWLPDWYRWNYEGAPTDGSVWDDATQATSKVVRGGNYGAPTGTSPQQSLRTRSRGYWPPTATPARLGFRCARAGSDAAGRRHREPARLARSARSLAQAVKFRIELRVFAHVCPLREDRRDGCEGVFVVASDKGKIEAGKPAQKAREILGEALGQIQDIRSGGLDLEVITASIAKAVRALFKVQSSHPGDSAHAAGVCEAMDHLRHTLALLQDVRSNEPAVLNSASTIARTLAILYPVSKAQERQSEAPGSPASIIRGPVADDSRRHEKRLAIEADIGFQSDTNFFTGFSEDISSGGLFIASYDLRPIGATMNINFTLPDGHLVSVPGVVRWIREYSELQPDMEPGMGVQFEGLSREDERAINRFLAQRPPMFFEE